MKKDKGCSSSNRNNQNRATFPHVLPTTRRRRVKGGPRDQVANHKEAHLRPRRCKHPRGRTTSGTGPESEWHVVRRRKPAVHASESEQRQGRVRGARHRPVWLAGACAGRSQDGNQPSWRPSTRGTAGPSHTCSGQRALVSRASRGRRSTRPSGAAAQSHAVHTPAHHIGARREPPANEEPPRSLSGTHAVEAELPAS